MNDVTAIETDTFPIAKPSITIFGAALHHTFYFVDATIRACVGWESVKIIGLDNHRVIKTCCPRDLRSSIDLALHVHTFTTHPSETYRVEFNEVIYLFHLPWSLVPHHYCSPRSQPHDPFGQRRHRSLMEFLKFPCISLDCSVFRPVARFLMLRAMAFYRLPNSHLCLLPGPAEDNQCFSETHYCLVFS